jgi:hypothetical protein
MYRAAFSTVRFGTADLPAMDFQLGGSALAGPMVRVILAVNARL